MKGPAPENPSAVNVLTCDAVGLPGANIKFEFGRC